MSGPARWSWLHGVSVHPQVPAQPCTRPSWNNPEKLLSRNTPGCSASKACCCVALQESVVVKVPTKFRSNLHRKSKEPSNVQAMICSLCFKCQSSKFAINMYVCRVTEKYLNPLSLSRNVYILTFTKLDHNIPMFYKKQDLYHFAQQRLMMWKLVNSCFLSTAVSNWQKLFAPVTSNGLDKNEKAAFAQNNHFRLLNRTKI